MHQMLHLLLILQIHSTDNSDAADIAFATDTSDAADVAFATDTLDVAGAAVTLGALYMYTKSRVFG